MAKEMIRFAVYPIALAFLVSVGCGKSTDVAQHDGTDAVAVATPTIPSPTDVVSQFLDQVRRGGVDSGAGNFLTTKAQSELQRIGRSVQPIGSPDARFEVTRAVAAPEQENSMLVQSVWSEPNADGTTSQFPVVWALELEDAGWRISGLAMELEAGLAPVLIDFEDGNRMAQLLGDAPSQAAGETATPTTTPAAETAANQRPPAAITNR